MGPCSINEANIIAISMNMNKLVCDWEALRTTEGFYKVTGGIDMVVSRATAVQEYCDLVWMETPDPGLARAKEFSDKCKVKAPKVMLSYNMSPSFNWDNANMTDDELRSFVFELGSMGYVWTFCTLAGFHLNALKSELFS